MKTAFKHFVPVFLISIVLLILIMFLPMYSGLSGTFNFEYHYFDHNFFEVMEFILRGNNNMSYNEWCVIFPLAAVIPAVALFIVSLCRTKVMCIISSGCGIAGVCYAVYLYFNNSSFNADHLLGDYASITITTWIILALFIIALIVSISIQPQKQERKYVKPNEAEENDYGSSK